MDREPSPGVAFFMLETDVLGASDSLMSVAMEEGMCPRRCSGGKSGSVSGYSRSAARCIFVFNSNAEPLPVKTSCLESINAFNRRSNM